MPIRKIFNRMYFISALFLLLYGLAYSEMLFQDSFDGKSVGWGSYGWGYANKVGGGITEKDSASAPASIAVSAVPQGYAGWFTPAIKLRSKEADIVLKIKLKISADYVGNTPFVWIAWYAGNQFLKQSPFDISTSFLSEAKNGWVEMALLMSRGNAPTNADEFKVNLTSSYAKGSRDVKGTLFFDDVLVESRLSASVRKPSEGWDNIKSDGSWNKTTEGRWSWETPQAKASPTGDLEWAPEPFVFKKGKVVRYIDFENGDDLKSGETPELPWKRHPWDSKSSPTHAVKGAGVDTYLFKRGVIYRGTLVAAESGTEGSPIRLTSDPTWGSGTASLYGSERIEGRWTHLAEGELPEVPERGKVWCASFGTNATPRAMWEIQGGKMIRIRLARFPNWTFSQPDDFRGEWNRWEGVTVNKEQSFTAVDTRLKTFPPNALKGALVFSEPRDGVGIPPYPLAVLGNNGEEAYLEKIKETFFTPSFFPGFASRYYIENAVALLDEGGEYWYDAKSGKIYLRLSGDRDPNGRVIEASCRANMISIADQAHIEISALDFRFDNPGDFLVYSWTQSYTKPGAILIRGGCDDLSVRHCSFSDNIQAVSAYAKPLVDIQDRITIADNDVVNTERRAIFVNGFGFFRVKILRNRIECAGLGRYPRNEYGEAVGVRGARLCEVAGNIIKNSGCSGIYVEPGKDGHLRRNLPDIPLLRTLVHHNKVENTMQLINDYGGIASWQLGPTYVYNNISGNPLGLFPGAPAKGDFWRSNTYIAKQFGFAYYLDGAFKNYLFNNIAWGKDNDLNGPWCTTGGFMDIFGLNHVLFNNTFYKFGSGVRRQISMTSQFANDGMFPLKCVYTGNLWLDISDVFLDLDADIAKPRDLEKEPINYATLYLTRNAFCGASRRFGATEFQKALSSDQLSQFKSFDQFKDAMRDRHSPCPDIGVVSGENPLMSPASHDFRPGKESGVIAGLGAQCFVPWGLYGVVGEWNFHPFTDDAKPTLFGEHMSFTEEYLQRYQYNLVPDNSLECRGVTRKNFVMGALENWTTDALEFSGKNAFCVLRDADIKRSMDYKIDGNPAIHYDGSKRKSLDMDTNHFLIEIVFKAEPGKNKGSVLVEKWAAQAGYRLRLNEKGALVLELSSAAGVFSFTSEQAAADGRWRHAIVEVDRSEANGVKIYLDGVATQGTTSGAWPERNASLANTGDFYVAGGAVGNFFSGAIDFLRVARGTLADAHTSIEELYAWEFKGPMMKDFSGKETRKGRRSAGAMDADR